jgi:uncharacterized membrane protein
MTAGRWLLVFLSIYGSAAAALLPRLSLWLDEILYLIGARKDSLQQLCEYAARNAGGIPLGYAYAFLSIHTLGYSVFAARLPSLLASLAACAGIFVLGRRLGMRYPILAVALFALAPLQFRYAMEARPYSLALALGIWATVIFLRLIESPALSTALVYGLLIAAALFTQPYSIFISAAHVLWLANDRGWPALRYVLPAFLAACACFLPWYLYASPFWKAEITTYGIHPQFGLKELQLIFKELVGMGYAGTILVLTAAVLGLRSLSPDSRVHWSLLAAVPIFGAVMANLTLGYFLAIRQMIYVLLPLSLLAAIGLESLFREQKIAAGVLAAALFGASLYENAHAFERPRENWAAAAQELTQAQESGVCRMAVPMYSWELYQFFQPQLPATRCLENTGSYSTIILAESPYEASALVRATEDQLQAGGWKQTRESNFQGPRLVYYSRSH